MRNQTWYIAFLIGLMCIYRFSFTGVAYINPHWVMEQLNIPIDINFQMPYVIRVWAIRGIVLAVLVASANKNTVKTLLLACIAIDSTDILSAHLGVIAGIFNESQAWPLKLAAIAALVPEIIALVLLTVHKPEKQIDIEKNS